MKYSVWKDEIVRDRLGWYYNVMKGYKKANFLICKYMEVNVDLEDSDKRLWQEHDRLSKIFDAFNPRSVKRPNFLDLKVELVNRMLKRCNMCEWNCNVDRSKGEVGVCKLNAKSRVASYFKHFGEEAPLVNAQGSGTIFFTGCIFKCVFCQNWDISQYSHAGDEVDEYTLAGIMKELYKEGACNINFVGGEPTPNLHTIIASMKYMPFNIPMIWNSDMYNSIATMKILEDVIDLWLTDFKYGNDECARRLSNIPRYFDIVTRNHRLAYDNDMIVRHLVMPNHLECCTKPILEWIATNTPNVLVNIMDQYYPTYRVLKYPDIYKDIARRVTRSEMVEAYKHADKLGLVYKQIS